MMHSILSTIFITSYSVIADSLNYGYLLQGRRQSAAKIVIACFLAQFGTGDLMISALFFVV